MQWSMWSNFLKLFICNVLRCSNLNFKQKQTILKFSLVLHWYYIGIVLQYWSPGIVLVMYCLKKAIIVHPCQLASPKQSVHFLWISQPHDLKSIYHLPHQNRNKGGIRDWVWEIRDVSIVSLKVSKPSWHRDYHLYWPEASFKKS